MRLSFLNKFAVIGVLVTALAYALPNVLPASWYQVLPKNLPQERITLGLDLQGGSHLVLQVDMADVIHSAYENLSDDVRQVMREAKLGYQALQANQRHVTLLIGENKKEAVKTLDKDPRIDVENTADIFTLTLTEAEEQRLRQVALQQTLEVLRARVDEFGVAEPVIQRQGDDRVIIQLPGIKDAARAKSIIGRTAKLTFHLVDDTLSSTDRIPANRQVLYETGSGGQRIPVVVHRRAALSGDLLTSAAAGFDQYSQPAVDIAFDRRGTQKFGRLSTEHVNRRFAIVLDGKVYSAPVFREPILGGRAQITGNFNVQESQDLATILNAGALPASVKIVEERTVGPSLGQDSVQAGKLAMLIGFGLVLVFMVVFYGVFGLAANIALLANMVIIIGVMSAVGFTLTLPGMAGIVLTIGMAVDANVLIFERIREELVAGAKPLAALEKGFKGVMSTIVDANITTLIAAVVLFAMGSGPVQGFALTLSIGVLSSMFTAIMLTRWLTLAYVQTRKLKKLVV